MKKILLVIIVASACLLTYAQDGIDRVLAQIEQNNTTLLALQKQMQAQKLANRVGLGLPDPEAEFNFLSAALPVIGKRTDISIRQAFDFPTAYFFKKHIAATRNEQLAWDFQKQRQALLLEARLTCIDLVHANAMHDELARRLARAQQVATSFQARFDRGETNILEFNKAQLSLLNARREVDANEIERNTLLGELSRLNGGVAIDFHDRSFESPTLAADFEQWYAQTEKINPALQWLKKEIVILQKQVKLSQALSLPRISLGYMSEKTIGERFHGLTAGISLPLWEKKHSVALAKANSLAWQSIEADQRAQIYYQMKTRHSQAVALQKSASDYRSTMQSLDSSGFLDKALAKGEISLIEYIMELSLYYDSMTRLLQAERDWHRAFAILNQYRQ